MINQNKHSPRSDICDRSWFWLSCVGPLVLLLTKFHTGSDI